MKQFQMEATLRTGLKKNAMNRLRSAGMLPAVVYGQGQEAVGVQLDVKEFEKKLRASGSSALIQLSIKDGSQTDAPTLVAVKALQRHPVTHDILHADFLKISMDKPMETTIPVHLIGVAPGVKEGGILSVVHRELHIKCLPALIPESLEVDISQLHIGDSLTIKDVTLAEGVQVQLEEHEPLVHVVAPKTEAAVTVGAEAGAEAKQPEVIGEKEREERQASKSKG